MRLLMLAALLLLLVLLPQFSYSAKVSGVVWDFSDMRPSDGAVVEVNTTPLQREVTGPTGEYFFELEQGNYILAVKIVNASRELETVASQELAIGREGNYTVDIPVLQSDIAFPELPNESEFEIPSVQESAKISSPPYLLLAAFFLVVMIIGYVLMKKSERPSGEKENAKNARPGIGIEEERTPGPDEPKPAPQPKVELVPIEPSPKKEKLPKDLREVVGIMKDNEGRMTQKDLRKHIPLSEAKVSLMIAELEDMGIVKKIKKGRGNILILKDGEMT
jgi:uncharacterized membrane protein